MRLLLGALVNQRICTLQLLLGAPLKAEYWIMMWVGNYYMSGLRTKEASASLPLNIPRYITLTMVLYENMKPIEHVLRHPICELSHLMCSCKHCNIQLSLYYWTHWNFLWTYHFKNTDLTRFFIIKPRYPGRLKNRSELKKPSVGVLVACGKTQPS